MSAINNSNVWRVILSLEYTRSAMPTAGLQITDYSTFISTFKKVIMWKSELGMAVVPSKTLIQC